MARNSFREDETLHAIGKWQVVKRLFHYLHSYKWEVAVVLVILAITTAITLVNPLIIESAIDDHLAQKDLNGLLKLGGLALGINMVYFFMVKGRMYFMAKISNHIVQEIRQDLYEHIQTLSFDFFDGRPTGKLLARIVGDVTGLKKVLYNAITTFIPGICTIIGVAVIMLVKDWRLAISSLILIPILIVIVMLLQRVAHGRWQLFRKKSSNLNAYVHENVSGMSVVQSFRAEPETKEIFEKLVEEHVDSFISAVRVADLFGPILDSFWGVSFMLLYGLGVTMISKGTVSVGLIVAFGSYIVMFWNPIMRIAQFYNQLITNITAAERVFEVLDTKANIKDKEGAIILPEVQGKVEYDHVSFAYDEGTESETKVLEDISFIVKPGERIALVGETGAGKTTIVNLLSRFYDICDGDIKIDGYSIKDVTLQSLRGQMGIMTQENFVFHGTVAENIRYGKMDATEEEVLAAAKAVSAHEFIMEMDQGYDTVLEERGAGLSIGQRQLIAFARTMISMPRILILDEATSSIDTKTELLVQKGIEALLQGRTSFVIAHRLSTIQNADRILVIGNEGIIESGTSQELLTQKGFYYNLYQAQYAG